MKDYQYFSILSLLWLNILTQGGISYKLATLAFIAAITLSVVALTCALVKD